MRLHGSSWLRFAISAFAAGCLGVSSIPQAYAQTPTARERLHQSEQWLAIADHLPDPATASERDLELQADILRARRFPDDALDYYRYALKRGGDRAALMNKMGLTELELHNVQLARGYFQEVVKIDKKDAEAWNNLGAVEYLNGLSESAVAAYKKAVKLNKRTAVFHSNLSTVYFEQKNFSAARHEIALALKLDPEVFDHPNDGAGVAAHLLTSNDRARLSFEMAKLYAKDGTEEQMLHSLAMASEAGMDVQKEMQRDAVLKKFAMDPRVALIVQNAQALRAARATDTNTAAALPSLADAKQVTE